MSELEMKELMTRTKALDTDEQTLVVKMLPDDILIEEYVRRFNSLRDMVSEIRKVVKL